jgi:hypothetical protein
MGFGVNWILGRKVAFVRHLPACGVLCLVAWAKDMFHLHTKPAR